MSIGIGILELRLLVAEATLEIVTVEGSQA